MKLAFFVLLASECALGPTALDAEHIFADVGQVLVVSGSKSGERAEAMEKRFASLGGGGAPMHLFEGVSGASLSPSPAQEGELAYIDVDTGLRVSLWDWTERGIGGQGMDSSTVGLNGTLMCLELQLYFRYEDSVALSWDLASHDRT